MLPRRLAEDGLEGLVGAGRAYLELVRPLEVTAIVAGTFVGARLALSADAWLAAAVPIALSNGLLFAGSLALNDWHDAAEDSINRPSRPVPSGRVTRKGALVAAVTLFALGVLLAFLAQPVLGLGALAVAGSSVAYSLFLKGVPAVGNLVCAVLTAYPIWCWTLWTDPGRRRVLLVVGIGLAILRFGAEILKTAEDFTGDQAAGIRTVATVCGVSFAHRLGAAILGLTLLAGWFLLEPRNVVFVAGLALCSALAMSAVVRAFLSPAPSRDESGLSRSLVTTERAIMVLLALVFGLGIHL